MATSAETYIEGIFSLAHSDAVFDQSSVEFVTVIIPVVEEIKADQDRSGAIEDLKEFSEVGITYILS